MFVPPKDICYLGKINVFIEEQKRLKINSRHPRTYAIYQIYDVPTTLHLRHFLT